MNIEFEKENYRFSARAAAIIYNKDKTKVLLFKVEDDRDYFLLPGGRIEFNEDSKTAITREIKEELGLDIDFELCSIQENFLTVNDKVTTQYCFCYKGIYNGGVENKKIECKDHDNQLFYWIDIENIDKYKLLPKSARYSIKDNETNIINSIERIKL